MNHRFLKVLLFTITGLFFQFGIKAQSTSLNCSHFSVEIPVVANRFFRQDAIWLGADGASSVDMGNGRVLWLFSDTFICLDSSRSRKNSAMIHNSIALQEGSDLSTAKIDYFWKTVDGKPRAYFDKDGPEYYWTGQGIRLKDKVLVFLMDVHSQKEGLGFAVDKWSAVLISDIDKAPGQWKFNFPDVPVTGRNLVGSAAVLKDNKYLYAYAASEIANHEVTLLRWELEKAYNGDLLDPEWYCKGRWTVRLNDQMVPDVLFVGHSEFTVNYCETLHKYIQFQAFGFGEAQIGYRLADRPEGPWSKESILYIPDYSKFVKPMMYAAKAHPEISKDGLLITYNINIFDFSALIESTEMYYPFWIFARFR